MKKQSKPQAVKLPAHGLFVLESHHADDFTMEEASWPFHKIFWIAAGKGSVERAGRTQPVRAGDLFYVPVGLSHRFVDHKGAPMTLLIVCFSDAVVRDTPGMRDLFTQFLDAQGSGRIFQPAQYVQNRVREDLRTILIEQQLDKIGCSVAVTALFQGLLVYLTRLMPLRQRDDTEEHFNGTVAHIDENFFRRLRSADLAAMCNVSERTYTGMFRKRMGMTVTDYIIRCRIEFAKERLLETGNIAYAAFESGFSDLAHFYRVFKKATGMPPGRFMDRGKGAGQDTASPRQLTRK